MVTMQMKNKIRGIILLSLLCILNSCSENSDSEPNIDITTSTNEEINRNFTTEIPHDKRSYLFTFDDNVNPNSNNFERWEFTTEQQFTDNFAWTREDAKNYFGTPKDRRPRMFRKTPNEGSVPLARISNIERAPGTLSGNSFNVYQDESSKSNDTGYWIWYGGQPISRNVSGINKETNRLSMYVKFENITDYQQVQLATYLSNGGPKEHKNSHFYHYTYPKSEAWVHILYDRHPSHLRGKPGQNSPTDNPGLKLYNLEYMPNLLQMYYEIRYPSKEAGKAQYYMDEVYFYSTKDTPEPDQNDESISSIWVGYWANDNFWEIGFVDESNHYGQPGLNGDSWSTYECRWSTNPITNENWENATPVTTSINNEGLNSGQFRKNTSWRTGVHTRFTISNPTNAGTFYFAIKDISKKGQNKGGPSKGDGRNSLNNYVHTIDYVF